MRGAAFRGIRRILHVGIGSCADVIRRGIEEMAAGNAEGSLERRIGGFGLVNHGVDGGVRVWSGGGGAVGGGVVTEIVRGVQGEDALVTFY